MQYFDGDESDAYSEDVPNDRSDPDHAVVVNSRKKVGNLDLALILLHQHQTKFRIINESPALVNLIAPAYKAPARRTEPNYAFCLTPRQHAPHGSDGAAVPGELRQ